MSRVNKPYKDGKGKYLQDTYGITMCQYNKMLKLQGGKCPICGTKLYKHKEKSGRRASPVDHDHGPSKRVRGILCFSCNRWRVGRNTLDHAKKVVEYLSSDFDGRDI